MATQKILLAGATGYLGTHITQELLSRNLDTKIIVRNKHKISFKHPKLEVVEAEVTHPHTLEHICHDIDTVISTVGITRQKEGQTYMDVDFQANANLIDEAKKRGVKKFIYISVLHGEKLRHLQICAAKEQLGDYLQASGLDYCIIRPSGFFSDMNDFLTMAKKGKVYLFGDGKKKINPIHGADLAKVVVDAIAQDKKEINVGGPNTLTQNEIAELALKAHSLPIKIIHLPDWIRKCLLWGVRTFSSAKTYGPIEFFLTVMAMDMYTTQYGTHTLEDFFNTQT